ncbi:hypothetical protein, partial [Brevibacterium samyangense]|uniref:hypothetical protein n=1 Tax=Brevibacterium samyangense TaxID=366888 RepID=UPI0031D08188
MTMSISGTRLTLTELRRDGVIAGNELTAEFDRDGLAGTLTEGGAPLAFTSSDGREGEISVRVVASAEGEPSTKVAVSAPFGSTNENIFGGHETVTVSFGLCQILWTVKRKSSSGQAAAGTA